ncbi:bestrophin family protein [Pseudomonas monteilii]|uniref:Effector protein n=2 Tax=Gammaproteobacteria TaxID=1236 RepID=A0AAP7KD58_9PSED|nr:bestrophin family ion channel [Pseudomonas monteilii]OAH41519.1 effector protein [Pseudomonas monteilii]
MEAALATKWKCLARTITYVGWALFWLLLWDVAVTLDAMLVAGYGFELPLMPLTLLCSALVVLISFRNSSAYNRWWEARTLWGAMVNSSRSFGRQVLTLIDDDKDVNPVKARLIQRHLAYLQALRMQLKGKRDTSPLAPLLTNHDLQLLTTASNLPNDILSGSAEIIAREFQEGRLDSIRLARLESTLVDISNWQGGMERIANTPLPYPYTYFPRIFSTLFCVIMPLSLVPSLGWFTPVVSTVVGCMLLAMERIGTDLQAPFGHSQHSIRTDELCRNIEKNLQSMFNSPERGALSLTPCVAIEGRSSALEVTA